MRRIILATLGSIIGLVLLALGGRWHIYTRTAAHRTAADAAPHRPVAIVLGAAIRGDDPSDMLEDRLVTALTLYENGQCDKLLLSGAHHREDHNEVGVMSNWLQDRGVPEQDIVLDHAGLRTLDSMVRAKKIFGADKVLVVTQAFHLPRAVYLGQSAGLEVTGVAAPARYDYPASVMRANRAREFAAQGRALLDLWVLGTQPKFMGPRLSL